MWLDPLLVKSHYFTFANVLDEEAVRLPDPLSIQAGAYIYRTSAVCTSPQDAPYCVNLFAADALLRSTVVSVILLEARVARHCLL